MSKLKSEMTLPQYLKELVLGGQYYFTTEEILAQLPIKESSLSVSLSRLSAKEEVKMIRKGFGIITGTSRGVLHPSFFIDAMMRYLKSRYYVGLLSAASHWGASHQAVMKYYVVSERVIKPISLGRMEMVFATKNCLDEITEIEKVAGRGGYYKISSPELTAIDLVRFPKKSGHLNNVATVLEELFEKIDLEKLKVLCEKQHTPTLTLQRLGFILDKVLGYKSEARVIERALEERRMSRSLLSVAKKKGDMKYSDYPFDEKWMLYENTTVEPD